MGEEGAVLVVERGDEPSRVILLERETMTIGRVIGNDVVVDDAALFSTI